jgi:hypothetical protein
VISVCARFRVDRITKIIKYFVNRIEWVGSAVVASCGKIECRAVVGDPDRCPAFDFAINSLKNFDERRVAEQ